MLRPGGDPVTYPLSVFTRSRIFVWADCITPDQDRSDAVATASNALPLLEFAEQATSAEDLGLRMQAIAGQLRNTPDGTGNPGALLAGARTRYAFVTGGIS